MAGRARYSMGYALAKGSDQNMGLYNVLVITTLAQTSAGYYIVGNCPRRALVPHVWHAGGDEGVTDARVAVQ